MRRTAATLIALTLVAAVMRLWSIGSPPVVTGDEAYFVTDAREYVAGAPVFDVHPPLGKLSIAAGIAVVGDTPVGWRIPGALFGIALVPLLALLAARLTTSWRVGLLVAGAVAVDPLFIVESRLALLNTTLVFFVALTLLLATGRWSWRRTVFVGLALGLAVATKWVAFFALVPVSFLFAQARPTKWLVKLGLVVVLVSVVYLGIFGVHAAFTHTRLQLVATHVRMLEHHFTISETHPSQSAWWLWPLLARPFVYLNPPSVDDRQVIADVGNPLLWWGGLAAALATLAWRRRHPSITLPLIAALAFTIPFAGIARPMFNYHGLLAAPFIWMIAALGWEGWVTGSRRRQYSSVAVATLVVAVSLWFWPVITGAPLTPYELHLRQWVPSWFEPPLP